jgi:hypothetical protein
MDQYSPRYAHLLMLTLTLHTLTRQVCFQTFTKRVYADFMGHIRFHQRWILENVFRML